MALYTSTFKIFFSIFLPFVIPSIKFNSKKSPGEIIEESDDSPKFDSMQMNEVMPDKDRVSHKQKISPEDMEDSSLVSKTKIIKHKLYKVQFLGGCTRQSDGINFLSAILYFYTAPVTVFWCNVLAYLVFLSIFSYFVLTDLYPTSHPKSPSTMEIVTWGWTITMVIEELRQLFSKDQRSFLYKFKNWFGNEWNKFDLMMYTLFLTSVVLRFALDDKDFIWARMCYSITLAMYFIRVMQYFYVEKNIGPKVIMINRMLMDLLFFFMILVVFILSFGVMYQANLFPNSPSSWKLLKQVVYHPYWQMYGELFLENLEGQAPDQCTHNETAWRYYGEERCPEQNAFVPLLLAGYMLLTNILLVNLLIAMFSDTFQKVQDNSEKVWRFHRFSLVYEFYDRPTLIPPLIFINHIFRGVRWIIYKCTGKFKYNNVFKRFLNNKDDERLRLFEKDAVEEHLHSMWTVEKDKMENKVSSTSERLDKVIEELDKIKEQVQEGSIPGIHHSVQTARSVTVMEDPATTRSHLDSKNLQRQMDELADYVKIQMKDMNEMMKQINMRLQPPPPPQPSTSSRSPGTVLDITDVSNDP